MLGDWIKNRDDIFKAINSGPRVNMKGNHRGNIKFPKTEAAIIKWLHTSNGCSKVVSWPSAFICQALELNKAFPEESKFIASDAGWLARFKITHYDIIMPKLNVRNKR